MGNGAIITLDEVKILNQISVSTYDTLIQTYIPIIQSHIINYCRTDFLNDDDELEFPDGLKDAASAMIAYKISNRGINISSKTIGSKSESYINGYPEEIMKLLEPYVFVELI